MDSPCSRVAVWNYIGTASKIMSFLPWVMTIDKVNLDIFWLRDEALEDSANLPAPETLAAEIVEDLRSALAQFEAIEEELTDEE
jgi:hypothetical protein